MLTLACPFYYSPRQRCDEVKRGKIIEESLLRQFMLRKRKARSVASMNDAVIWRLSTRVSHLPAFISPHGTHTP